MLEKQQQNLDCLVVNEFDDELFWPEGGSVRQRQHLHLLLLLLTLGTPVPSHLVLLLLQISLLLLLLHISLLLLLLHICLLRLSHPAVNSVCVIDFDS